MQTAEVEPSAPTPPSPSTPPNVRLALFLGAALVVVVLDQLTKSIVRSSLELGESWPDADWPLKIKHITNSGAAFGILEDQTAFLIVMACIGLGAIYLYYRNPPFDHWIASVAIGMMLGGAAGNLIDRIRVGEVTDFIDLDRYPAFNVADSAIFLGVATIIIGFFWSEQQKRDHEPAPHEDAPADG
jgi:signal peptidase II